MHKIYTRIAHPLAIILTQAFLLLASITCENRFIAHLYKYQRATQQLESIKKTHQKATHRFYTICDRGAIHTYATQQLKLVPISIASIKHLHGNTTL